MLICIDVMGNANKKLDAKSRQKKILELMGGIEWEGDIKEMRKGRLKH